MRQLATGDAAIVFGVGFLFSDDIASSRGVSRTRSSRASTTRCRPASTLPPNLAALVFKEEEGSYLVGALAGCSPATDRVGFVGGMGRR
jgi:basic membrane protein A